MMKLGVDEEERDNYYQKKEITPQVNSTYASGVP